MRRLTLFLTLIGALAWSLPASAQNIGAQQRSVYENVIIGEAYTYEQIALTGSAKPLTASKIHPADYAVKGEATSVIVTINTGTTLICFEGTTATAGGCHSFPAGSAFMVYGARTLKLMSLYSAGSTVDVTYCRSRGK
jgi:hypothetical protein